MGYHVVCKVILPKEFWLFWQYLGFWAEKWISRIKKTYFSYYINRTFWGVGAFLYHVGCKYLLLSLIKNTCLILLSHLILSNLSVLVKAVTKMATGCLGTIKNCHICISNKKLVFIELWKKCGTRCIHFIKNNNIY